MSAKQTKSYDWLLSLRSPIRIPRDGKQIYTKATSVKFFCEPSLKVPWSINEPDHRSDTLRYAPQRSPLVRRLILGLSSIPWTRYRSYLRVTRSPITPHGTSRCFMIAFATIRAGGMRLRACKRVSISWEDVIGVLAWCHINFCVISVGKNCGTGLSDVDVGRRQLVSRVSIVSGLMSVLIFRRRKLLYQLENIISGSFVFLHESF